MRISNCYLQIKKIVLLFAFVITLCVLPSCTSRADGEVTPTLATDTQIAESLKSAKESFAGRADLETLRQAVAVLGSVRDPSRRSFEVEWKFSKYSLFLGRRLSGESEKEALFEKGRAAGLIASRMEPGRPEGHFWYGANLGELSKISPVTVGIKSVDDIREAMYKVIEIQPDYQTASAYDALAQLELATRIYGGKVEKAVEYLEKGLSISPENARLKVDLAEAYIAVRRRAEGRKQIDELLKMPPHPDYIVEHNEAVAKAKVLLAKNF